MSILVTNSGNTAARGVLNIYAFASTVQSDAIATPLGNRIVHISLAPNKSRRFTINLRPGNGDAVGNYYLSAQLLPAPAIPDNDVSDKIANSLLTVPLSV